MHVLNLRVREEGNFIQEWKQKRWLMNQNEKKKSEDISDHVLAWYKMGKGKNAHPKKKKIKKKVKKKKQVPRVRISILTGTAFAVQCSTHWAAGNLPWKESKV